MIGAYEFTAYEIEGAFNLGWWRLRMLRQETRVDY